MSKMRLSKYILLWFSALSLFLASSDTLAQAKPRKRMGNLTLQKLKSAIPPSKSVIKKNVRVRNVGLISPPSSKKFYVYDDDPRKAEYNRLVDEEIKRLYKLSKQYKRSRSRGEI